MKKLNSGLIFERFSEIMKTPVEKLFEIANKPKKFLQVEEDDHMLTFNDNLLSEIKNFINKY